MYLTYVCMSYIFDQFICVLHALELCKFIVVPSHVFVHLGSFPYSDFRASVQFGACNYWEIALWSRIPDYTPKGTIVVHLNMLNVSPNKYVLTVLLKI